MLLSRWSLVLFTFYIQCLSSVWAHRSPLHNHNTGRTREFDFTLTWEKHAPDGFSRSMFLVNGQSPGPVIEVNQDDWVVVRVKNASPFNATVHFHGIEMHGTPWSDGTPGLAQRPICPKGEFVYKFQATQYGSYWYHSHYRGQIEDGLYGAILIHPRPHDPKPFHLISNDSKTLDAITRAEENVKPLVVSDLSHLTSSEKWDMTVASGVEDACYDSIIFNGKGAVSCLPKDEVASHLSPDQKLLLSLVPGASMTDKSCIPPEVFSKLAGGDGNVTGILPGTFSGCKKTNGSTEVIKAGILNPKRENWIALDIVGAINFITGAFSIDEHDMWVYAMDGSYIHPQKVQALILSNGYRYSVLVKTHKVGKFKVRLNAVSAPQLLVGNAILDVKGPHGSAGDDNSKPYINIAGTPLSKDVVVFNEAIAAPFPPQHIPQTADALYKLNMKFDGASYLWALNSTRLMPAGFEDRVDPILFDAPNPSKHDNVTISTRNNTWIDLVLISAVTPMPPHPVHKHGNKVFLIGAGSGAVNWSSVEEARRERPELFNLVSPPSRDTFATVPAITEAGWIVVRYHVVNPGAWLLHCHISTHMQGGMSMVIQDGVDKWPKVPEEYLHHRCQSC